MPKIVLKRIRSGYNFSDIQNNFATIQEWFNNNSLHNVDGNNDMLQPLDMNGYTLLNADDGGLVNTDYALEQYNLTLHASGGNNVMSSDIQMSSFAIRNLGAGVADEDLVTLSQVPDFNGNYFYTIKNVTSPHRLSSGDSGAYLLFDSASNGTIEIPDGIAKGTVFKAANLGGGTVVASLLGSDTLRGSDTLNDTDGEMSFIKESDFTWTSSERIPFVSPYPDLWANPPNGIQYKFHGDTVINGDNVSWSIPSGTGGVYIVDINTVSDGYVRIDFDVVSLDKDIEISNSVGSQIPG